MNMISMMTTGIIAMNRKKPCQLIPAVKALLESDIYVNVKDKDGNTALHTLALAITPPYELYGLLLAHEASATITNNGANQMIAWIYSARNSGQGNAIDVLKAHSWDVKYLSLPADEEGDIIVHILARKKSPERNTRVY